MLPLPAFLKRRLAGDAAATTASLARRGAHGPALAQVSMAAAQYGDPTMPGWMKATAVAAAVAVAGVGAGAAGHARNLGGPRDERPAPVVRQAAPVVLATR